MPVPFFANSVEDRDVMLKQRGVPEVREMAVSSSFKFVGIGTAESSAQTVTTGVVTESAMQDVRKRGGVGELIGHFFDENGQRVRTELADRTLSVGIEALKNSRIVAVGGGDEKVRAIGSILRSGLLNGLITDERTAKALIN